MYHSGKALVAYAGIDAPPYQSGQFIGTKRHISKRGSSTLRKIGYELMDSINKHQVLSLIHISPADAIIVVSEIGEI